MRPISLYAQTKVDSERALLKARSATPHPTILAFATVFGMGDRSRFDCGQPPGRQGVITVYNGQQWRPSLHVRDLAEAVVQVLEAPVRLVSGEVPASSATPRRKRFPRQPGQRAKAAISGATGTGLSDTLSHRLIKSRTANPSGAAPCCAMARRHSGKGAPLLDAAPPLSSMPAERIAKLRRSWDGAGSVDRLTLIAWRYILVSMIRTFGDKEAEKVFLRQFSRRFQALAVAKRKLNHLTAATALLDLAEIPGNPLEALKGDRAGQHSIRINDQYRICFRWKAGDAYEVEITTTIERNRIGYEEENDAAGPPRRNAPGRFHEAAGAHGESPRHQSAGARGANW